MSSIDNSIISFPNQDFKSSALSSHEPYNWQMPKGREGKRFGRGGKIHSFFADWRRSYVYSDSARQVPIAIEGGKTFVNAGKSSTIRYLLQSIVRPTGKKEQDFLTRPSVVKVIGALRLGTAVGTGVGIYTVIEQIIELADEKEKKRITEGTDAALRIIDALSVIADTTGSFAMGLSMVKVLEASQVVWAAPLAIVGSALSVAALALEYRGLKQSETIFKRLCGDADAMKDHNKKNKTIVDIPSVNDSTFAYWTHNLTDNPEQKQKEKAALAASLKVDPSQITDVQFYNALLRNRLAIEWLRKELIDVRFRDGDYFLKRHFEVINREKYSAQILFAIDNHPEKHPALLDALKGRIKDKIWSHRLAMVSITISLIGATVLFCGMLSVGLGCVGFAGLIGFGKFIYDYRSVNRLEDRLDSIQKFEEIPEGYIRTIATFAIPVFLRFKILKEAAADAQARAQEAHKKKMAKLEEDRRKAAENQNQGFLSRIFRTGKPQPAIST